MKNEDDINFGDAMEAAGFKPADLPGLPDGVQAFIGTGPATPPAGGRTEIVAVLELIQSQLAVIEKVLGEVAPFRASNADLNLAKLAKRHLDFVCDLMIQVRDRTH